uniref:Carbohydrate sulfotransferase n=1 Tax=Knipowitschia caucasica TaxID=637954 RepID=A0AAV2LFG5_KNICA
MRHHWLLLGACGWVLLILMFVTKFINFRANNGYGERVGSQNWTESGTRAVRVQNAENRTGAVPASSFPSGPSAPWDGVIHQRNSLLKAVCRDPALHNLTHRAVTRFVLDRIFVSDKHKLLFCQTPKVGNTQWKKVLIVLNGAFPSVEEIPENIVHNHEKNGLPRLSSYSPQEVTERLGSYFKFLIVRDPFERLISAFKDKFVLNPRFEPWYKTDIAPAIIRKYRRLHRDQDQDLVQDQDRPKVASLSMQQTVDSDPCKFVLWSRDCAERFTLQASNTDIKLSWVSTIAALLDVQKKFMEAIEDPIEFQRKEAGLSRTRPLPSAPPTPNGHAPQTDGDGDDTELVQVTQDFVAVREDEISVFRGEKVQILASNQQGQSLVYRPANSDSPAAEGWVPRSALKTH